MADNIKHNRNNVNRVEQRRRDNDNLPDKSIGLYDIDETIKYYFDQVIKLQVTDGSGEIVKVPTSYATPENWQSYQTNKIARDNRGKIQLPLVVFKRDSITKDRNLGNKVDPSKPLYTLVEDTRYSGNKYDRFNVLNGLSLQGRKPVQKLQKIIVPDFITVQYSVIMFTEFLTQMNKLIEAVSYGESSYWGDSNKYMVRAKVDDFPTSVEINMGEDRIVKSEFQININGHIIPQNIQTQAALGSNVTFTAAQVKFGESVTNDINDVINKTDKNTDNSY